MDTRDETASRATSGPPEIADKVERERTAKAVMAGLFGDEASQLLAGRFRLIELLGAGAMGSVYLAQDTELDRHVAVKRLTSTAEGDGLGEHTARRRARMVLEARALAKVNHPNVVGVHDVRTEGDDVFVAMEFVAGQTIHGWLRQSPTREQILEVFTQAARGLAAAHAVGLVHRDVKPTNMIVGADGRVRVVDFGLAMSAEATSAVASSVQSRGSADGTSRLTKTGAMIGTPSYMAPEQLRRGYVDARSDQFGLCVSLYEAVAGHRPFTGKDEAELLAEIERGVAESAAEARMPRWLLRTLQRGLHVDPAERFDGLDSLARAIDPARRRRARRGRWAAGAGVIALAAVGLAARATAPTPAETVDPCPLRPLEPDVWGPDRGASMEAGLTAAISSANGADLATAVRTQLASYADRWARERQRSCEDTYVDRVQSEALFDLRMRCLQRRAARFDVLVDRLSEADERLASRAPIVVAKLPALYECSDRERLAAAYARPADPTDAHIVARVEELHDRASAEILAGALEDGRATLAEARRELKTTRWPVMDAQLALQSSKLLAADEMLDAAERSLLDATAAAEGASADNLAARAWLLLVWQTTTKNPDPEKTAFYLERAQAAVTRLGNPPDLYASLQQRTAAFEMTRGDYDAAIDVLNAAHEQHDLDLDTVTRASMEMDLGRAYYFKGNYLAAVNRFLAASELFAESYGPRHPQVASALSNLGSAELIADHHADARTHLQAAFDIQREVYGADHPRLANTLNSLASIDYLEGRFDDALTQYRRVRDLHEHAKGPDHPALADPLANVGRTLARMGRHEEALQPAHEAVRIIEAAKGRDHPDVATALTGLGGVQAGAGKLDDALRSHTRALEIRETAFGAESPKAAESGVTVADVYRRLDRPADARRTVLRWLPIMREQLGPAHPHTAPAELTLGWLELDAGNRKEAAAAFRRADEGLGDDNPSARALLDLGLGISTFDEDPTAGREWLTKVIDAGEDGRFATMQEKARAFLASREDER